MMIISFTTSTYVLLYMTTYASQTLHMGPGASFGATVANGVCGLVFTLLGGHLSDRLGRKPVMITARSLFLVATLPAFFLMNRHPTAVTVIAATAVMSALSSTSVGAALVALTESIRKENRSMAMAVLYAVAVTLFGGIAQPGVSALVKATGNPMAPAWYLMAAALMGVIAMILLPETRPVPDEVEAVVELA